jgi:hypothetical protein
VSSVQPLAGAWQPVVAFKVESVVLEPKVVWAASVELEPKAASVALEPQVALEPRPVGLAAGFAGWPARSTGKPILAGSCSAPG